VKHENINMRILLISLLALLLNGCSLFEKTPESVVKGQRAVYQAVLVAEENDETIIKRYLEDTKKAVLYHIEFVFEPKINAIRENPDLSREDKSMQIAALERERQATIDELFGIFESNAEDMRTQVIKHHTATRSLIESIYNYLSTSPIEVDNIEFWIEKLKQVSEEHN